MRIPSQQPRPRPGIRRDSLVAVELGGMIRPGIVLDDDVDNPIRLVDLGGSLSGILAETMYPIDQEAFEGLVCLERALVITADELGRQVTM